LHPVRSARSRKGFFEFYAEEILPHLKAMPSMSARRSRKG
jgi:hypothetical protein